MDRRDPLPAYILDLPGLGRDGRLVVIELKRTSDGGHLELQALRYAAMVSAMTFADVVDHYEQYLARVEPDAVDEARGRMAEWLDDGEDATLSREVRIVLVAAGFDREITTTVLWLTDIYGLDSGQGLIDRRLYLPETTWCAQPERRKAAGVPRRTVFATKPTLARQMITAAHDAGVPARWFTGDEV